MCIRWGVYVVSLLFTGIHCTSTDSGIGSLFPTHPREIHTHACMPITSTLLTPAPAHYHPPLQAKAAEKKEEKKEEAPAAEAVAEAKPAMQVGDVGGHVSACVGLCPYANSVSSSSFQAAHLPLSLDRVSNTAQKRHIPRFALNLSPT
jgi:hypothetical protein